MQCRPIHVITFYTCIISLLSLGLQLGCMRPHLWLLEVDAVQAVPVAHADVVHAIIANALVAHAPPPNALFTPTSRTSGGKVGSMWSLVVSVWSRVGSVWSRVWSRLWSLVLCVVSVVSGLICVESGEWLV